MRRAARWALVGGLAAGLLVGSAVGFRAAARRHLFVWLPAYVQQQLRPEPAAPRPIHVMVLFTDHFEPKAYITDPVRERARMSRWSREYPLLADKHRDAAGRVPQHTFFYPVDEFEPWTIDALNQLVFDGYGEIELHLHHVGDTEASLRRKLENAKQRFASYGALVTFEAEPRHRYGFIHGNWALDNSEPEQDFCGVNRELDVLRETGCYADFTFPAVYQAEQPRTINSIYYAVDDPRPKSYDVGAPAAVGTAPPAGGLLLVQGVLGLRGRHGPFNVIPGVEVSGNFYWQNPPTPRRADHWIAAGIHVKGQPEWVFVKLHCHGAEESEMVSFFDGPMDELFTYLESAYNDGREYILHYVTAREAYNIISAAEAGRTGDPDQYRDFVLPPPANTVIRSSRRYRLLSGGSTVDAEILESERVQLSVRTGPVAKLTGALERLRIEPDRVSLTLRASTSELELRTRRAVEQATGAELQELERAGDEFRYLVSPHEPGVVLYFQDVGKTS